MVDATLTEVPEEKLWQVPAKPLPSWPSCGCGGKARFVFLDKVMGSDRDWVEEFDRTGRQIAKNPNFKIGHIGCRGCGHEWKFRWELNDNFVEFTEVEKDADVSA